jgi:copper chaperone
MTFARVHLGAIPAATGKARRGARLAPVFVSTPLGYAWSEMTDTMAYNVPKIHCAHCGAAIKEEVSQVARVEAVDVDLDTKVVTIRGESLDDTALRAAIEEAGYEAA